MTYVIHLLQMLEESIKVCFAHRVEQSSFAHVLRQFIKVSLVPTRSRWCLNIKQFQERKHSQGEDTFDFI